MGAGGNAETDALPRFPREKMAATVNRECREPFPEKLYSCINTWCTYVQCIKYVKLNPLGGKATSKAESNPGVPSHTHTSPITHHPSPGSCALLHRLFHSARRLCLYKLINFITHISLTYHVSLIDITDHACSTSPPLCPSHSDCPSRR